MTHTDTPPETGRVNRVTTFRARVRALPGGWLAWRIGVTVIGVAIIVGGIILLPLPGPGWLIIFAGLGVLSTEYEWAKRLLRFARAQVSRWTDWIKDQPRWMQAVVGVLGLAFLAAVFYVVYLVLYS
jgi:uncharacterized protein (TIGR02611 family)